jgi:hypothetical protein
MSQTRNMVLLREFTWSSLACSFANSFRDTPFKELLLAPHSKRFSASDHICEANTNHKVWTQGYAFLSTCRTPKCARTKCTGGNWRAGEQAGLGPTAHGTGAAPLTHGQARHACCSRCSPNEPGASTRRARHSTLCSSSSKRSRSTRGPRCSLGPIERG